MQSKIIGYWIAWNFGKDNSPRGGVLKLKLEGDVDQEIRVVSLAELMALDELLRTHRPLLFDLDTQVIQTPWQRLP